MDNKFLESSEFYNKRFNNFSTLVIVPVTILLLLVLLFSFVGRREITIESMGVLGTKSDVPLVQSPTNSAIKKNYLVEGKNVKKGDLLVTYMNKNNQIKLNLLDDQKETLKNQISALDLFRQGVSQNADTFEGNDTFGYRELLHNYLNQRSIYTIENQMLKDKSAYSNNKISDLSKLYQKTIDNKAQDIEAYQKLFNAIQKNESYPSSAKFGYIYDNYVSELNAGSDKNSVRGSYLSNLQQQFDSMTDELNSAKTQKESLKDFNDTDYSIETNNEKIESLQNDQQTSISEQLVKVNSDLRSVNSNIKELKELSKNYRITASKSGVIHLNDESTKGAKYIGAGTELARIYPKLNGRSKVKLQSYISSKDISSIKKGQRLRLEIVRNVPRPIVMEGSISNISIAPVPVNNGSYYVVTSESEINEKTSKQLHFGMTGKVNVITGKETFFKYYSDKLLDKN
ncbi:bacteriocin secretion accessory protein [Companilactobacillus jidongensis]|uniref:bacteriocin secretion accessory protein n=1 Tax=Companilactobacillus jidongensis TaxID=2486006 RepID=UPI000F7B34A7|nr:bacteriocin secretion accessory protein [Companilactobacillus jidongensis]